MRIRGSPHPGISVSPTAILRLTATKGKRTVHIGVSKPPDESGRHRGGGVQDTFGTARACRDAWQPRATILLRICPLSGFRRTESRHKNISGSLT